MTTAAPGTAPQTFGELEDALAERYASLSRQLQKIARFVLEHPDDLALETVATVARRAQVQPSSMVRFAQAFGYDGFSDMQQVFRALLVTRSGNYRERIETLRRQGEGGAGDPAAVLADTVEENIRALRLLGEHTPPADLARAVELLAQAREVCVVAERRAFPVAFYLTYAIGRLERRVRLLDGLGGMLREQARTITPRDALVAVSFPPYSPAVVELLTEQRARDVPAVAVTDSPVSPIALQATVSFGVKQQEERAFRSLVAPMCLAKTLVVALGHHLVAKNDRSTEP